MGWKGLINIASALRVLGSIHGARSERRRCQEHDASTAHALCPRLCCIHSRVPSLYTMSPASRSRAQRHGPGRVQAVIKLRRDHIPCRDPTELKCSSRKKSDQVGQTPAHSSTATHHVQFLYPPSQAPRDQAHNGICQQSRSSATHLPAVAQPCSLARSRGTYNQWATLRCPGFEVEGQTYLDPFPLNSSHHRRDCAQIADEGIALEFPPSFPRMGTDVLFWLLAAATATSAVVMTNASCTLTRGACHEVAA